jgi:hypothetical protein
MPYDLQEITGNVTDVNFEMESIIPNEFTVSGKVTSNGVPLEGVTIEYTINGVPQPTITTLANGTYSIANVPHGSALVIETLTLSNYSSIGTPHDIKEPITASITGLDFEMGSDSTDEFTVSGKVTSNGLPLAGVTIDYTINGTSGSVITDRDGKYSIANVQHGSAFIVTGVTLTSYKVIETMPHTPILVEDDIENADFTMRSESTASFTVSGKVTSNGFLLAGVTIDYIINGTSGSTSTLADGTYSITVPHGSAFTLEDVTLTNFIVNEPMPVFGIPVTASITGQDFTMTSTSSDEFSVSGKVTSNGFPLEGVTVDYTINGVTGSTTTDVDGKYVIEDIPFGSAVIITDVTLTNYAVNEPMPRIIPSMITADVPNVNFTMRSDSSLRFTVSGTITAHGLPLANVAVQYTIDGVTGSTLTLSDGTYSIINVPFGSAVVITGITLVNYAVSETIPNPIPTLVTDNVPDVDFTMTSTSSAKFTVSGTVTANGLPFEGVEVAYTINGVPGSAFTLADGTYSITVPHGAAFTLEDVTLTNFAVNESMPIFGMPITANITGQDFTMMSELSGQFFTVSGSVTANGLPLANATITYTVNGTSGSTATNVGGSYTIGNAAHGSAVVITGITLANYEVIETLPHRLSVPVTANVTDVDFTMRSTSPDMFTVSGKVTINGIPLAGVKVEYEIDDGSGTVVSHFTTTAADGTYTVYNIPLGAMFSVMDVTLTDYTVTEAMPYDLQDPVTDNVMDVDFEMESDLSVDFTVTGTVTVNGLPLAGVTIEYTINGNSGSATTGADGKYEIKNIPHGSALVISDVTLTDYKVIEAMPHRPAPIVSDLSGVDFTMESDAPDEFTVSGSVTSKGLPLEGVVIDYTINGVPGSATTDKDGKYSIANITHGSALEITGVTLTNYKVDQTMPHTPAPVDDDVTINFTMSPVSSATYTVSGSVTTNGLPLAGVAVNYTLDGTVLPAVTTDSDGNYIIRDIPHGSVLIITSLTLTNYSAIGMPHPLPVPVTDNVTDVDLGMQSALPGQLYSASGKVTVNGLPLIGVDVGYTINGGPEQFVTTGVGGTYTISNIQHGSALEITSLMLTGYVTTAGSLPHSIPTPIDANITGLDFTMESRYTPDFVLTVRITGDGFVEITGDDGISYALTSSSTMIVIPGTVTSITITATDGTDVFIRFVINGGTTANNPETVSLSIDMIIEAVFTAPVKAEDKEKDKGLDFFIFLLLLSIIAVLLLALITLWFMVLKKHEHDEDSKMGELINKLEGKIEEFKDKYEWKDEAKEKNKIEWK